MDPSEIERTYNIRKQQTCFIESVPIISENIILQLHYISVSKSFLASGDFYRLLIAFANRLDTDQDRQNVGPDLDPNHLTL